MKSIEGVYVYFLQFDLHFDGKVNKVTEMSQFVSLIDGRINARGLGSDQDLNFRSAIQPKLQLLKFIGQKILGNLHFTFVCMPSACTVDKSKVEILQNFVAFSEYLNFTILRIVYNFWCRRIQRRTDSLPFAILPSLFY